MSRSSTAVERAWQQSRCVVARGYNRISRCFSRRSSPRMSRMNFVTIVAAVNTDCGHRCFCAVFGLWAEFSSCFCMGVFGARIPSGLYPRRSASFGGLFSRSKQTRSFEPTDTWVARFLFPCFYDEKWPFCNASGRWFPSSSTIKSKPTKSRANMLIPLVCFWIFEFVLSRALSLDNTQLHVYRFLAVCPPNIVSPLFPCCCGGCAPYCHDCWRRRCIASCRPFNHRRHDGECLFLFTACTAMMLYRSVFAPRTEQQQQ